MSEPGEGLDGFEEISDLKSLKKEKIKVEKVQDTQQDLMQQSEYMGMYAGQTVGVSKSRSLYALSEDVHRDKVSLGKKTWKPKGEQIRRNVEIDNAKKLTKDATADTVSIYTALENVYKEQHYEMSDVARERRFDNGTLFNKLISVHFTPKMITRSYLKKNFARVYDLVYSYSLLKARRDTLPPNDRAMFDTLAPKMELLSRRLHNYCEKNHVSLMRKDGVNADADFKKAHIISDKDMVGHDYARFSEEDTREWFSITSQEKEERQRARKQEALTLPALSSEEINEAMTKSVSEDEMFFGDSATLLSMSKEERIRNLPAIKKRIAFILANLKTEVPKDADKIEKDARALEAEKAKKEQQLAFRKELIELQAVQKLAVLQATLANAVQQNLRDLELADKVFESSEELRALKKRANMTQEHQPEVTVPAGIISLTREEALSTDSDKKSFAARTKLFDSAMKITVPTEVPLNEHAGAIAAVKEAAVKYFDTNHYSSGYKAESAAMRDLKDKLSKLPQNVFDQIPELRVFKALVDSQTNGGLVVDMDYHHPELIDAANLRPEDTVEEGGRQFKKSVSFRDGAMNNFFTRSWDDKTGDPLFAHEPTVNDLRQGKVSNCWMVSGTTAAINYDPDIIKNCMKDNGNGTVTVRLYRQIYVEDEHYVHQPCAQPVYITVKKEVPKLITGGAIQTSGALWMQMLEKAAAFLGRENGQKGYRSLWYGTGQEWFFALTGRTGDGVAGSGGTYRFNPLGLTSLKNTGDSDRLFQDIMDANSNGYVYHYGSKADTSAGMNSGHAYTVLGGRVVGGERYVLLRNPYANMSLKYGEDGKQSLTESYFSSEMNETCGQFLIKYDDFLANMQDLSRTNVKQDIRFYDDASAEHDRIVAERKEAEKAKANEPKDEKAEEEMRAAIQKELEDFEEF